MFPSELSRIWVHPLLQDRHQHGEFDGRNQSCGQTFHAFQRVIASIASPQFRDQLNLVPCHLTSPNVFFLHAMTTTDDEFHQEWFVSPLALHCKCTPLCLVKQCLACQLQNDFTSHYILLTGNTFHITNHPTVTVTSYITFITQLKLEILIDHHSMSLHSEALWLTRTLCTCE